jgi:hypothetical protein
MIALNSLLRDPRVLQASPDDRGDAVRTILSHLIGSHGAVQIDLSETRTLTPSFAYKAFGRLYDEFHDVLPSRLTVINDSNLVSERIFSAIERRKRIVATEKR